MRKFTHFIAHHKGLVLAVLALLSFNLIFLVASPEEIVNYIGVDNTYFTLFLIASIGGVNIFTSGILYGSIATFAAGGASPLLLALAGGAGIAVGDSLIFLLFRYGFKESSPDMEHRIEKLRLKLERFPRFVQYLFIFVYLAFTPLPNDILMFTLAVLRFQFIKIFPFILAGGIFIAYFTATIGNRWPF